MNFENVQALMSVKDHVSYADKFGNLHFDFSAWVEYKYGNNIIREQHTCEIINIDTYKEIGLRILTHSEEINPNDVHIDFSSAYGSFKFEENHKILKISGPSGKIGDYSVSFKLP